MPPYIQLGASGRTELPTIQSFIRQDNSPGPQHLARDRYYVSENARRDVERIALIILMSCVALGAGFIGGMIGFCVRWLFWR